MVRSVWTQAIFRDSPNKGNQTALSNVKKNKRRLRLSDHDAAARIQKHSDGVIFFLGYTQQAKNFFLLKIFFATVKT